MDLLNVESKVKNKGIKVFENVTMYHFSSSLGNRAPCFACLSVLQWVTQTLALPLVSLALTLALIVMLTP